MSGAYLIDEGQMADLRRLASELNTASGTKIDGDRLRDIAQTIQAKLDGAEGPIPWAELLND